MEIKKIPKYLKNPLRYMKLFYGLLLPRLVYLVNRKKILKLQKELLMTNYDCKLKKAIIFLVPGRVKINGGVMSISSLAKFSKEIMYDKGYEVFITTLPKEITFNKYTEFDSEFDIFNFNDLLKYFKNLEDVILHIPDYSIDKNFFSQLTETEKEKLKNIKNLKINILNQNILLMPSSDVANKLRVLSKNITMTTAHRKYCTKELAVEYMMPVHFFSAEFIANYKFKEYGKKENIILYSPDFHENKKRIVKKLKKYFKNYKLIEIKNMKYKNYLDIISRAKFMITFGEGLDGYFEETFRCGGIAFAVYNEDFFLEKYREIDTLFESYELLEEDIIKIIEKIDNEKIYTLISKKGKKIIDSEYSHSEYLENLRSYYKEEYTFNEKFE